MRVSRYRRDIEIRSPNVHELHDVGTVGSVGSLRLRVRGRKVDAYVPIASSYTNPPRFVGELSRDSTGIVVKGRMKESAASALWTRVDAFVIVILLALVVLGILGLTTGYSHGGLAPLLIGVLGSPVFALLFSKHQHQRRTEWREQSDTLAQQLARCIKHG